MIWRIIALVAGIGLLGTVVVLAFLGWLSHRPRKVGLADGRLAPCADSPNCVSTQATDAVHHIEPLRYTGSVAQAMEGLQKVLATLPRCRVVSAEQHYLLAEFTSSLFQFVDDVEFFIDDGEKTIHFRSASRVGHSDFGANRRRMESIRAAFEKATAAK
jgi:uncharacterized protein (DUF1499 family)